MCHDYTIILAKNKNNSGNSVIHTETKQDFMIKSYKNLDLDYYHSSKRENKIFRTF